MKKALLTLLLAAVTGLSAWAGKPSKLESLARQYKGEEGFEMISLGKLGMRLFQGVAVMASDLDEEDKAALKLFKGLNKITIVDFEDIRADKKAAFEKKAQKILRGMDLILEAKDSTDSVKIYGIDDGEYVRDCILYSSDGTMIITRGRLSLNHLGNLMEMAE